MSNNIISHPRTNKQLLQYVKAPTHALGLNGDNGAGKGYIATYVCAQLLNIEISNVKMHPYVSLTDISTQKTGIDDIRDLQKFLTLTVPGTGVIKRVVILEHADLLGHEAQNALLKTLEEPPNDTVIIVTYSRDTLLLPTIHSRLQTIQISPVTQEQAKQYFPNINEQDFSRAFFLSGGLPGLLTALMNNQSDHPLIKAIEQARRVITLPRYKRLGAVDSLLKNKDFPLIYILDGLYRLIDASYRVALRTKPNNELNIIAKRLKLVENAMDDIEQNVQSKLVVSRLFLEL